MAHCGKSVLKIVLKKNNAYMRATHFINWQIELHDDVVYPVVVTFPAQLPLTVEVKVLLLIFLILVVDTVFLRG